MEVMTMDAATWKATALDPRLDSRVVSITDPTSAAAEQYRVLHMRLDRARQPHALGVMALTSAVAGEGKSLSTANLAAYAARRGRRVAVLDCDLRRPSLGALFGASEGKGLAGLLSGRAKYEEVIRIGPERLTVFPAGDACEDPGGLFSGPSFRQLIERLRGTHQEIYLDLPPALPFADAPAAAALADGVILVVRSGDTPSATVAEAVDALAGTPLLGCVLTGCEAMASIYRRYYKRRG